MLESAGFFSCRYSTSVNFIIDFQSTFVEYVFTDDAPGREQRPTGPSTEAAASPVPRTSRARQAASGQGGGRTPDDARRQREGRRRQGTGPAEHGRTAGETANSVRRLTVAGRGASVSRTAGQHDDAEKTGTLPGYARACGMSGHHERRKKGFSLTRQRYSGKVFQNPLVPAGAGRAPAPCGVGFFFSWRHHGESRGVHRRLQRVPFVK